MSSPSTNELRTKTYGEGNEVEVFVAFGLDDLKKIFDPSDEERECPIFLSGFEEGLERDGYSDALIRKLNKLKDIEGEKQWTFIFEGSAFNCHENDCRHKHETVAAHLERSDNNEQDSGSIITLFRKLLIAYPTARFMVTTSTPIQITEEDSEKYLNAYAQFFKDLCASCKPHEESCRDPLCTGRVYILFDHELKNLSRTRNEVEMYRLDARLASITDHDDPEMTFDKAVFDATFSNHCFHDNKALDLAMVVLAAINATRPKYIFFFGGGWVNNLLESFHKAYPLHTKDGEKVTQHVYRVEWNAESSDDGETLHPASTSVDFDFTANDPSVTEKINGTCLETKSPRVSRSVSVDSSPQPVGSGSPQSPQHSGVSQGPASPLVSSFFEAGAARGHGSQSSSPNGSRSSSPNVRKIWDEGSPISLPASPR